MTRGGTTKGDSCESKQKQNSYHTLTCLLSAVDICTKNSTVDVESKKSKELENVERNNCNRSSNSKREVTECLSITRTMLKTMLSSQSDNNDK